jgi:NAD(P)-dependent dehydrogenase (short-subunit alcohol dehydrogenase family)
VTSHPVAVVTASGGMMGSAIARRLADDGARIVVNDRNESRAEATGQELRQAGHQVLVVVDDVSTRAGADHLIGTALDVWGQLDILVNVAGGIKGRIMNPIWEISDEEWSVTLSTNLTSAFLTTRAALGPMMAKRSGCIINTASTSWAGSPHHAHYAAAKAGLVSLTRSVASQVGEYGIRANVIAPGGTKTRAALRSDADALQEGSEHLRAIPLGRLNEPSDIAAAVAFLASDAARNISGQILTIAGGLNPSL